MPFMALPATENLVTWNDTYSVGVARIDDEHRKLIRLMNDLYAAIVNHTEGAVLAKVLDGLVVYTRFHFSNEEALLKRYAYPGLAQHRAEHDKLVAQVDQLQSGLRDGKQALSMDTMTFLQGWLIRHILGTDKKYSRHLNDAGVK